MRKMFSWVLIYILLSGLLVFTPAVSAAAKPTIHALLISGADVNPKDHSMGAFKMYQLLQATGKKYLECDVRIDILKAPEIQVPEYANATPDFVNTYSRKLADADPIPITAENILEWVNTVSPCTR